MVIFEEILRQNLIKMYPKTHEIAPFFQIFSGEHAPEPPNICVAQSYHYFCMKIAISCSKLFKKIYTKTHQ